MIDLGMVIQAGSVLVVGGVAWGSMKYSLADARKVAVEVKAELVKHTLEDRIIQDETIDRLARIETKLDSLMGR